MRTLATAAACIVLPLGMLSGQQVWKVNAQGSPGANFTDLPAAVAAANPGDEIWVYYNLDLPPPPTNFT